MSPTGRAPPGDSVARSRDVAEVILSAPGHKYTRERNELLQLLSHPHVQVNILFFVFFFRRCWFQIKE